mgnify:CR=1 FL=1
MAVKDSKVKVGEVLVSPPSFMIKSTYVTLSTYVAQFSQYYTSVPVASTHLVPVQ